MLLQVSVDSAEDFDTWVRAQKQPANQDVVSAYCPEHGPSKGRMKSGREDTPMLGRSSICSIALMAALCVTIENAMIEGARAFDDAAYPDWKGAWFGTGGRYDTSKPAGLGQQAPLTPEFQKLVAPK